MKKAKSSDDRRVHRGLQRENIVEVNILGNNINACWRLTNVQILLCLKNDKKVLKENREQIKI